MNSTFLDDKYFVRGKEDINLYQDSLMFYVDTDFSTSHDYMVAKILANDKLEVYLKTEAAFFEQSFAMKLTDIYRTYLEIKIRSTPAKYLDTLKSALLRKMEEDY